MKPRYLQSRPIVGCSKSGLDEAFSQRSDYLYLFVQTTPPGGLEPPPSNDGGVDAGRLIPFVEREERRADEEAEGDDVVPFDRLAEIGDREDREHHERDDLLHCLQLRCRIDLVAVVVGGDGE